MIKIVVDTNVLISSVLSSEGKPSKIMSLVSTKKVQFFYSPEILDEYKRVLAYEKLSILPHLQTETILKIITTGTLVTSTISKIKLLDEDDRVFYDVAKGNDAILITGNIKHYPTDSAVMTPSDFLLMFEESEFG